MNVGLKSSLWLNISACVGLLALLTQCNPDNRSGSRPDLPSFPPSMTPTDPNDNERKVEDPPIPTTFRQGLFLGEDPRVHYHNGYYYSVYQVGNFRQMFRSKSIVNRGPGKVVPEGYPLFSPIYIERLNGVDYNAWFAFDINIWRCDCKDPYEEINQWKLVSTMPMTGWSIDFEVFKNPQPGPHQDKWYMTWAGSPTPSTGFNGSENVYIAELLDLRKDSEYMSTFDNLESNIIVRNRGDWTDVIAEAPHIVSKGTDVSLIYSGNGAQTSDYALGIALLIPGRDPKEPTSWIDYNRGGCPEEFKNQPEFAKTDAVWGPGVARIVPSPQADEMWMVYHSKVWNTFNRGPGTQGQQQNNQMWTRQIHTQPIGWRELLCNEQKYTIPNLGQPIPVGTLMDLPSGDAGWPINREPVRVEAELMLPFGEVMGQTMAKNFTPSTDVLHGSCSNDPNALFPSCSKNKFVQQLSLFAADSTNNPKQSGLTWHNSPQASRILVATSSKAPAQLDLWKNNTFVQTLNFPASGQGKWVETTFDAKYNLGDSLQLIYVEGKHNAPLVDYIEFMPQEFYDLQ